jgi:hypothetical protein
MKKLLLVCVVVIAALGLTAQTNNLPRLAVVEFNTNVATEKIRADAVTVRSIVESQMVATGRYQIISREEIDKLLANQRIQAGSISSSENVKKLQLANISYIVTGDLNAMGNDYAVVIKILDVSTGQFSHSDNELVGSGSRELYTGLSTLTGRFNSSMVSSGGQVVQSRVYKIGDFGPAGGIVFYDKGTYSAGWRYLEAAPPETEFRADRGGMPSEGTERGIGFGKRNTQAIVSFQQSWGWTGTAAQRCATLDFDGFTDWFLPSRDELDLMYKNLKTKGLGGFTDNEYCSSTGGGPHVRYQNFGSGDQNMNAGEIGPLSVRAVRAF